MTAEFGDDDLEVDIEIAGLHVSQSDIGADLPIELPLSDAAYFCEGDILTIEFQTGEDSYDVEFSKR